MAGDLASLMAGTPGLNTSAPASQFNMLPPQAVAPAPAPVSAPQQPAYYGQPVMPAGWTGNAATDSANNPYYADPFGAPIEQYAQGFLPAPPQLPVPMGSIMNGGGILQDQGMGTPIGSIPFNPSSLAAIMAGSQGLNSSAPASQFNVPGVTA